MCDIFANIFPRICKILEDALPIGNQADVLWNSMVARPLIL